MLKLLLLAAVAVECATPRANQVDIGEFQIVRKLTDGNFGPVFEVRKTTGANKDKIYAMEAIDTFAKKRTHFKTTRAKKYWRQILHQRDILKKIEERLSSTDYYTECRWIRRLQYASVHHSWVFFYYKDVIEGETLADTISNRHNSLDITARTYILVDLMALVRMLHEHLDMALGQLHFGDILVDNDGRLVLSNVKHMIDLTEHQSDRTLLTKKDWKDIYTVFRELFPQSLFNPISSNLIAFLHDLSDSNFDAKTGNDFFKQQGIVWKEVFDRTFTHSSALVAKKESSPSPETDITKKILETYKLGGKCSKMGISCTIDPMFNAFSYVSPCAPEASAQTPLSSPSSTSISINVPLTDRIHFTDYEIVQELKHGHVGHAFEVRKREDPDKLYAMEAVDTVAGWQRFFNQKPLILNCEHMKRERDTLVELEKRIFQYMETHGEDGTVGFIWIRRLRFIETQNTWVFFYFDMVTGGTLRERLLKNGHLSRNSLPHSVGVPILYDLLFMVKLLHETLHVAYGDLHLDRIFVSADDGRLVLSRFEQMHDLKKLPTEDAKRLMKNDYDYIFYLFSNLLHENTPGVSDIAFLEHLDDDNFYDTIKHFNGMGPKNYPFPPVKTFRVPNQAFNAKIKKYKLGGKHSLNNQFKSTIDGILDGFPYVPNSAPESSSQIPLSSLTSTSSTEHVKTTDFTIVGKLGQGHFGHASAVRKQHNPDDGQLYAMEAAHIYEGDWLLSTTKLDKKEIVRSHLSHVKRERDALVLLEKRMIASIAANQGEDAHGFDWIRRLHYVTVDERGAYFYFDMVDGGTLHARLLENGQLPKKSLPQSKGIPILYDLLMIVKMLHKKLNVAHTALDLHRIQVDKNGRLVLSNLGQMRDLENLPTEDAKRFKNKDWTAIYNLFSAMLEEDVEGVNPIAFLKNLEYNDFYETMRNPLFAGINMNTYWSRKQAPSLPPVQRESLHHTIHDFDTYGGNDEFDGKFKSEMDGILHGFPYVPEPAKIVESFDYIDIPKQDPLTSTTA